MELITKHFAELASFVSGGALFWVGRLVFGYFFVNLSVQLEFCRTPSSSPKYDDLVAVVRLKKGNRAMLRLDEVVVSLSFEGK